MKRIEKIFKKQTIIEQYRVEKYFINLFFPVHKLGIEIGHLDRSEIKEQNREKKNPELILSELILIKKILILMLKLVKFKILFMSLVKN